MVFCTRAFPRSNCTDCVAAVDHSLLSRYVLKPYWWSQVINLFPMSMAPNAVCVPTRDALLECIIVLLTRDLDHPLRLRFCHLECSIYAILFPKHGPELPGLGLLVVGYRSFPLSDLRCDRWHSGVRPSLCDIFQCFVLTEHIADAAQGNLDRWASSSTTALMH